MSFSSLKTLSLKVPLLSKSLESYEERLNALLAQFREAAAEALQSQHQPVTRSEVMARISRVRDLGKEAREEVNALTAAQPRIYEDASRHKALVRHYRAELSRLLLDFERGLSSSVPPREVRDAAATSVFFSAEFDRERERELQKINSSLSQIHAILQEFSQAVSDQGEVLGDIEGQIETVAEHTKRGATEFEAANSREEGLSAVWKVGLAVLALLLVVLCFSVVMSRNNEETE